jgi:hypothetical protein
LSYPIVPALSATSDLRPSQKLAVLAFG